LFWGIKKVVNIKNQGKAGWPYLGGGQMLKLKRRDGGVLYILKNGFYLSEPGRMSAGFAY